MNLKVIAYAHNGHSDKFGIPRQSREESPILTRIVFEPEYQVQEALRGIEGFSHLWLIWGFDQGERLKEKGERSEWSPTVRPPRLGGNTRMGVFATRSPFRPNPIGLSSVRLIKVESRESKEGRQLSLLVSGADVMDGTPIYDIKPYLSFSDSHPEAVNGFAEEHKGYRLEVTGYRERKVESPPRRRPLLPLIGRTLRVTGYGDAMPESVWRDIEYILRQDPRPAYQDDPQREYKMDYNGWRVTFRVEKGIIFVKNTEKIKN